MQQRMYIQLGMLMEKHGYTNQSLSDASGVPVGTVSGIRSGQIANPGFEAVCALMRTMGESVDAMMGIEAATSSSPADAAPADAAPLISALEARIAEKDERLRHRDELVRQARRQAKVATIISYASLALFALLFLLDFFLPTAGWIRR